MKQKIVFRRGFQYRLWLLEGTDSNDCGFSYLFESKEDAMAYLGFPAHFWHRAGSPCSEMYHLRASHPCEMFDFTACLSEFEFLAPFVSSKEAEQNWQDTYEQPKHGHVWVDGQPYFVVGSQEADQVEVSESAI